MIIKSFTVLLYIILLYLRLINIFRDRRTRIKNLFIVKASKTFHTTVIMIDSNRFDHYIRMYFIFYQNSEIHSTVFLSKLLKELSAAISTKVTSLHVHVPDSFSFL